MSHPNYAAAPPPAGYGYAPTSQKSFLVAWILSLLFGVLGVDRFYLGKVGTGLLKLVTIGGLGIWALVDLVLILANKMRDKRGLPLEGYDKHKKVALIVTGVFVVLSIIVNATRGDAAPTSAPAVAPVGSSVPAAPSEVAEDAAAAESAASAQASEQAEADASAEAEAEAAAAQAKADEKAAKADAAAQAKADEEAAAKAEAESGTVSQQNALRKAESYLDYTAFSRSGLIKQLAFEGYSNADAKWAVDRVTVNWNEQAVKKAKSYLEFSGFSRSGLIKQLVFEGYTQKQAEYGVSKTGL